MIKEVELRSRRAQFICDRNYNRIGLQLRAYAPSILPVKKLRRLLHKRRKVRVFVWKGIGKISFLTIPLPLQLIQNHDTEVYDRIASCYVCVLMYMQKPTIPGT